MKIKAIVEIPSGSRYKYEYDKDSGKLKLDRPLNQCIPNNYGFAPGTLCGDGDPLDVFILARHAIQPLAEVEVEIVGVLKSMDGGFEDDKLIAVLVGEPADKGFIEENVRDIANFLSTYKEGFIIDRYENAGQAVQTYQLSQVWPNPAD